MNIYAEKSILLLRNFIQQGKSIGDDFGIDYYQKHLERFEETIKLIPYGDNRLEVLEIGATNFFQVILKEIYNYKSVVGTVFTDNIEEKNFTRNYQFSNYTQKNRSVSINIENDIFPFQDESLDVVLMCEVIEHLDIDPMFTMSELNRILKKDAIVIITTPNICSARNLHKIMYGYRPHFFMQYEKSRSPFKHNFEYDIHALSTVLKSSGFEVVTAFSKDVFEPTLNEAIKFIQKNNLDQNFRGDDFFIVAKKTGAVINRWPSDIYI